MNYDIGDKVEDAFVAYLKSKVSGDIMVLAAGEKNLQYPCACVLANEGSMLSERHSFGPYRRFNVQIGVMTEAANEIDSAGTVVKTVRERNATTRESIMTALNVLDSDAVPAGLSALAAAGDRPTGLAAQLCVMGIPGVWIQLAQPASPYIVKSVDDEHKAYVSTLNLTVIAQAVEI